MLEQVRSPYLTPWLQNPIGPIMEQVIPDFGRLNQHHDDAPDLYVAATGSVAVRRSAMMCGTTRTIESAMKTLNPAVARVLKCLHYPRQSPKTCLT
jgi:hypothetical protein